MKRLTAKIVESIARPGKYHDGDAGLYLYVQERRGRLRKSYVQRLTVNGRRVEIGLGSTRWTTPSEARDEGSGESERSPATEATRGAGW